jgi:hypothetical protein
MRRCASVLYKARAPHELISGGAGQISGICSVLFRAYVDGEADRECHDQNDAAEEC